MDLQQNLITRVSRIRLMAFDVDGVLTDGGIYIGNAGEAKRFNARDGMGLSMARKAGIHIVLITGRQSEAVSRRARELQIDNVFQGVTDKLETLCSVAARLEIQPEEILFMGDDINDLPAMEYVGLAVSPGDAVRDVKAHSHHVTLAMGGHGAVREIIEIVLRNQGKWAPLVDEYCRKSEAINQ